MYQHFSWRWKPFKLRERDVAAVDIRVATLTKKSNLIIRRRVKFLQHVFLHRRQFRVSKDSFAHLNLELHSTS